MKNTKLSVTALILVLVSILLVSCSPGNSNVSENNDNQTQQAQSENKPDVNNIFLSKSEITLSPGEKYDLIATISPASAEATLSWSSSNESVAEVNNNGTVTAKSDGNAVIKVSAPNGVLTVCNVDVKAKVGSVTGNVTYKYNDYVGNKPDTGTIVMLVPKSIEQLNASVALGSTRGLPDGCFGTKVDGSGNYTFDNVPVGDYYIIMISNNTNEDPNRVVDYRSWSSAYMLFSKEDRNTAMLTAKVNKTRTAEVSVSEGKTTTYSYDFGVTYI